ncbi:hypothetical protein EOE67_07445 [Rheinheimera riviphila]|uniref:Uncharacterized protein n=1 Tax=Rheinheimera riviphila TaxID=1834037 RepID=A0A437R003_9GAMM|nr:hypothetical protein [Rheinheimera riviphila]RVU40079.1 hypothetical protein EOE67_07445 [Rheinheimera riviphila]
MTRSLSLPLASRWFAGTWSWQPLLAVTQAVFWPSRWLAMAWLLAIGLLLVGIVSNAGLPLISGIVGLLSLHLSIPIQINNLTSRKSWLLLPHFKSSLLILLLILLALWLLVITGMTLKAASPSWFHLPYVALLFSLVMLPTIYVRHLWPLLAEIVLLMVIVMRPDSRTWLVEHRSSAWFISLVIAMTVLMWLWMKYRWLHPARRVRDDAKRTSVFALYGIEIPWLLRLTRRPASLAGTMLLGDGDSWVASLVRATWATWLAPATFWLISILFGSPDKPSSRLWSEQTFLVLLTLCPLFTLSAQQQKLSQRLGRCWLVLGGCRQTMYGFAERVYFQELLAYLAMTLVLMLLLVPYPMIVPLLCYGISATLLLCYLIFALAGQHFWWSISANLLLLLALLVAIDFLWAMPQLIYLTSLALVLPVYSLRRYGKARWLNMDYSQLKPKQLL